MHIVNTAKYSKLPPFCLSFCTCIFARKDIASVLFSPAPWPMSMFAGRFHPKSPTLSKTLNSDWNSIYWPFEGFACIFSITLDIQISSEDGNFLQEILIDEGVAAVDALSRAAVLWRKIYT